MVKKTKFIQKEVQKKKIKMVKKTIMKPKLKYVLQQIKRRAVRYVKQVNTVEKTVPRTVAIPFADL